MDSNDPHRRNGLMIGQAVTRAHGEFSRTEEVPIILGGNIFGYACSPSDSFRVLDAAHEAGVRRVDTADVYSDGESERIIGEWLHLRGLQDEWKVYTKVGHTSEMPIEFLGAPESVIGRTRQSLNRLKLSTIYMQQLHHPDPSTHPRHTLDAASHLQESGMIHGFGVSNVDPLTAAGTLWIRYIGELAGIQVFGNWVFRDALEALIPTLGTDQQILIYGVLGRGVLSGRHLRDFGRNQLSRSSRSARVRADELNTALTQLVRSAQAIANEFETGLLNIALEEAWIRGAYPIVGCRTPDQVQEASNCFRSRSEKSFLALQVLRELADVAPRKTWDLGRPPSMSGLSAPDSRDL